MRIGVLGTGVVGRAVAARFAELGHDVRIGTRDVGSTMARSEPDGMGNPPFAVWQRDHEHVSLGAFDDVAAHGEVVVNASSGTVTLDVLKLAGAANLDGKVLLDIANALDVSAGFPYGVLATDTDSLGEQIQREFPAARVVKSLNTLNVEVMVRPTDLANADHTVFVSGDDADAKAIVTGLLGEFGYPDVIDLGDISTARGTEMFMAIWLRLVGALGTAKFNVKVVR